MLISVRDSMTYCEASCVASQPEVIQTAHVIAHKSLALEGASCLITYFY